MLSRYFLNDLIRFLSVVACRFRSGTRWALASPSRPCASRTSSRRNSRPMSCPTPSLPSSLPPGTPTSLSSTNRCHEKQNRPRIVPRVDKMIGWLGDRPNLGNQCLQRWCDGMFFYGVALESDRIEGGRASRVLEVLSLVFLASR